MLKLHALAVLVSYVAVSTAISTNVSLSYVKAPPKNISRTLDPRLASFSMEFAYMDAFGGNKMHPNLLTKELMQRLVERTGVGPDIRPGGISIDSTIFQANSSALVRDESDSGGIYRTTYGPGFFETLSVFPQSSKYVVTVNLGNNTISIARDEIAAAIKYIGWDNIRAIELGNEADHYHDSGSIRPVGWDSADYTAQFLGWTSILTKNLSLPQHIFQAGGFVDSWSTALIISEGVESANTVKLYGQHTYQYSTCDPVRNAIATLPNLVNHQNITAFLDLWKPQVAAAKSVGKEFVVGEYGSVSCSGKENVTNTFGQALWLADTILYGASIDIARMYLHQGATLVFQSSTQANSPGFSWYDLWYPTPSDRYGSARASPSFVSYLLVTEAVGSSQKSRIAALPSPAGHPNLAAYAIWDSASRSETDGPARLAILNLEVRNITSADDLGEVRIELSTWVRKASAGRGNVARVKRMTAPGLDSTDSATATWAEQSYENGTPSGLEVTEALQAGNKVTVRGSEGVLVFF